MSEQRYSPSKTPEWWDYTSFDLDNPVAICGPVGPVEQLPLVAAIINNLKLDVRDGYFAGMDELWENGQAIPYEHDLCFRRIDMEWCFNLIRPDPH